MKSLRLQSGDVVSRGIQLDAAHGVHSSKISSFISEAIRAAMTPDMVHASLSSFLLKMSQEIGISARPKMK